MDMHGLETLLPGIWTLTDVTLRLEGATGRPMLVWDDGLMFSYRMLRAEQG